MPEAEEIDEEEGDLDDEIPDADEEESAEEEDESRIPEGWVYDTNRDPNSDEEVYMITYDIVLLLGMTELGAQIAYVEDVRFTCLPVSLRLADTCFQNIRESKRGTGVRHVWGDLNTETEPGAQPGSYTTMGVSERTIQDNSRTRRACPSTKKRVVGRFTCTIPEPT